MITCLRSSIIGSFFRSPGFQENGVLLEKLEASAHPKPQKLLQFARNLLDFLKKQDCQLAIDELNPDLVMYLFHLYERSGLRFEIKEPLQIDFKKFLQTIGSQLRCLVAEFDKARSSGKKFTGMMELLALLADHEVSQAQEAGYDEVEFLSSSLADREPPLGMLVTLPSRRSSLWVVDFAEEKKGAFVYTLRPVNDPHGPAILVCRGTAGRLTATGGAMSLYNDIVGQLGMPGAQGIWPSLQTYFKSHPAQETELLGKSLGGSIAQTLGVLLQGSRRTSVTRVATLYSANVCDDVHDAYNQLPTKFPVVRFRLAAMPGLPSDFVPKMGGYHLGTGRSLGADFREYDVGVVSSNASLQRVRTHRYFIMNIITLFRGIGKTHTRQMRWVNKSVILRSSKQPRGTLEEQRGSNRKLERWRLGCGRLAEAILKKCDLLLLAIRLLLVFTLKRRSSHLQI